MVRDASRLVMPQSSIGSTVEKRVPPTAMLFRPPKALFSPKSVSEIVLIQIEVPCRFARFQRASKRRGLAPAVRKDGPKITGSPSVRL